MLIRKLFKFENAHIVRGCSTRRCSHSIHDSYKVELLLEAHVLDRSEMGYDFGLLRRGARELIDAFDHAVTLWSEDDPAYLAAMQQHSERWVLLPVSPSAEQFSRVFFRLIDDLLDMTDKTNDEGDVTLPRSSSTRPAMSNASARMPTTRAWGRSTWRRSSFLPRSSRTGTTRTCSSISSEGYD